MLHLNVSMGSWNWKSLNSLFTIDKVGALAVALERIGISKN